MSLPWVSRRYLPALGFAVGILVTSLVPVPETGGETLPTLFGVAVDKWVHAAGYGLLTALLVRARRCRDAATVAGFAALVAGYGAAIELLQWPLPARGASGLDALANAAGAALAALAWLAVVGRREGRTTRSEQ